eukprot:EST45193.1 Hypothetical protein SS50377_jh062 [Spironucleus salmonicida]
MHRFNIDQFPYSVLGEQIKQNIKSSKNTQSQQYTHRSYCINSESFIHFFDQIQEPYSINQKTKISDDELLQFRIYHFNKNDSCLYDDDVNTVKLFQQIRSKSINNSSSNNDQLKNDSVFMKELKNFKNDLDDNENYIIDKILKIPKQYIRKNYRQTKCNNEAFSLNNHQPKQNNIIRSNINLLRFNNFMPVQKQPEIEVKISEPQLINYSFNKNSIVFFRLLHKPITLLEPAEVFDNVSNKTFYICKKYFEFNFKQYKPQNWNTIQQFLQPTKQDEQTSLLAFQQLHHLKGNFSKLQTIIFANINFLQNLKNPNSCLFINIQSLKQLVISNCVLQKISILDTPELEKIFIYNLSQNVMVKPIQFDFPLTIFNNLPLLSYLHLIHCDLKDFSIKNNENLKYLSLQSCFRVPRLDTSNLPENIIEIDIKQANLRISPILVHLENLTYLDLSQTKIKQLDFSKLSTNLLYLFASGLQIIELKGLQNLENLINLDLSFNQIMTLQLLPISIQTLNLQNNPLTSLNQLEYLINLKQLNISNTESLETDFWFLSSSLISLIAKNCKITALPDVRNLINLKQLDLSYNTHIEILGICLCENIQKMSLQSCGLKKLPDLSHLQQLQLLNLDDNQGIEVEKCNLPMNLEDLQIQNCNLQNILLSQFQKLKVVNISGNQLQWLYICQNCIITNDIQVITVYRVGEIPKSKKNLIKMFEIQEKCNKYQRISQNIKFLKLQMKK